MRVHPRVQLPHPWTSANAMEISWGAARSPEGSEQEPPATGSSPQPMSLEPPREAQCALHVQAPREGNEDLSCQLCTVGSAMPLSLIFGCAAWQVDLVPDQRSNLQPPAVEARSPNHWTPPGRPPRLLAAVYWVMQTDSLRHLLTASLQVSRSFAGIITLSSPFSYPCVQLLLRRQWSREGVMSLKTVL